MDITPQNPQQSNEPVGATPPPPPTPSAEPTTEEDSNVINVNVLSSAKPAEPVTTSPQPEPKVSQINVSVSSSSDDTVKPIEQTPTVNPTPEAPVTVPVSTPNEVVSSAPQTPTPEVKQNTPIPQTQNSNQMQSPTVFDTNQYHLPIEHDKKHNAGLQMLIFGIVFVIVLIIGGLLAIDAGLIDLGFESPINLIK